MFVLVLAHPGYPGQNPESRKTVVVAVVVQEVVVQEVEFWEVADWKMETLFR